MKTLTVLLSIFFIFSLGAPALADENKDHICFHTLDANQDGEVTIEEFERVYKDGADKFKAADADKDGKLTHDEYHDSIGHGST